MYRLQADSEKAAERFLDRVVQTKEVWLLDDDGYIVGCGSNEEDRSVMPFFSARAYAVRGNKRWGSECQLLAIPLDHFLSFVLPNQIELNNLVGLDWDANMAGVEWEPHRVLSGLQDRMKGP